MGDAELAAHCLGELAGAFADVSDVQFGGVGFPFLALSQRRKGAHHADLSLVLSFC